MNYVEFKTIDKEYKLALSTSAICQLEKKIGCNPLTVFGDGEIIPTVTTMVAILHASLLKFQHKITEVDACNIFDAWLEDDHAVTDFVPVILDIYKASGLIKVNAEEDGSEDNEKN